MNRFFTLVLAASCLTAVGQVNPDFNPDYDGDGFIGVNDILGTLSWYDSPWGVTASWSCGDSVSYQGYDYATVLIGEQCWFAENLRNELYNNGDSIPANLSDSLWAGSAGFGAVAVYGEGSSSCANLCYEELTLNQYGRLYNYYAVVDIRGLCPSGWHVPTDEEWMTMEMELGMSEADANGTGWRGTDQGTQMKTTYGWSSGFPGGTNTSGFSGLPGGHRFNTGAFVNSQTSGYWWTSSPYGNGHYAWCRYLSGSSRVARSDYISRHGFSVRCVRDAE